MQPIPATPKLFGANYSSGVPNIKAIAVSELSIEIKDYHRQRFQQHARQLKHLPQVLGLRIAAYMVLSEMELPVYVNSLVHRLSEIKNPQAVVVPCNALLTAKTITADSLLEKAQAACKYWNNPKIYVKGDTWFIGDFAIAITPEGVYYQDIGGANRRINNLAVACHNFRGVDYSTDEIALLDSISSFYCWLSMYLPYSAGSGAKVLDLGNFILRIPMDGREDSVSYAQEEMMEYSKLLWKTMIWTGEAYPTTTDKRVYLPSPFKSKDLVRPLHALGLMPVVKGGVDFVPVSIGAVQIENGMCLLSSKASKALKRLTMPWGVVCEVLGQQPIRFRHTWQSFGMRYITTAAVLPSHIAAPGVGWDLGSGLVIHNPKWAIAYCGELYDHDLNVKDLVGLFNEVEITNQDDWFVANCDKTVQKNQLIGWINCKTCQIPIKAHTNGRLTTIRWRLNCRYEHVKQIDLVVETCIVEESTEWKARSGTFKAMMTYRPPETILGRHNARVVFLKDTIKAFDSVVDLLDICAETFSRMPDGSKYRIALREANQQIGIDSDTELVFDAEVAINGGYRKLLDLLEDWKRPVTTRELVSKDTAEFIRQFLNLHSQYDGWVIVGQDHWRKEELEVKLVLEHGELFLYQTGLGYISTPERPLYMGQKAEYVPVADCAGIGNVLPNVLLSLDEQAAFNLYNKHVDEAVDYCNALISCYKNLPAKGIEAVLDGEHLTGLSPSELFEIACESGDYIRVGGREYPIRLIKNYLGGYDPSNQYTLARTLGDYLFAYLFDHSADRQQNLRRISEAAFRVLCRVAETDRLRKVVTCCVPAVNAKTIALPEIPIDEVWITYSDDPSSLYQLILTAFGEVPEIIGVYRAPMITAGFYRLVVQPGGIGEHVFAMNWLASYFDQGDHDGDGRTIFNATGMNVQLASLNGMFNFVKQCLGIDLMTLDGLKNGPKDLFVDHYQWLTEKEVNKKRGIKPSNYKTSEEIVKFNEGSYKVYTEGVGISYHLCNYPFVLKKFGGCKDITWEQLYGAQTLYEKVLGGWSSELEEIIDWLVNGGDMPVNAIKSEGFQIEYAENWRYFYNLVRIGQAIDSGMLNPNDMKDIKEELNLLETAWVAFQLFRSAKVPRFSKIRLHQQDRLAGYMLDKAYSINEYEDTVTEPTSVEEPIPLQDLTEEQQQLIRLVLEEGASVDLNGRAGTGKTFVLKRLISAAKKMGYKVLVGAPTGQAALLYSEYGGTTCARLFGYNADADKIIIDSPRFKELVMNQKVKFAGKLLIIIDEKSMISNSELRLAYEIVKAARNDKPCQWVIAGDYGQFPPVEGDYAFKSCIRHGVEYRPVMEDIGAVVLNLTKIIRQPDPTFQEALDWAYWGIAIHPLIKARLTEAPDSADRYYYNNKNVSSENLKYVEEFIAAHPDAEIRTYRADMINISASDLRLLMPVTPEMTLAVGMTFTITKNVAHRSTIQVANGEQVVITKLNSNGIEVMKADGTRVTLSKVRHDLIDPNKEFRQLPGYVGPALSLYKCQGKTLDRPSVFELWNEIKGGRTPLRLANALYVAASRVTQPEHLYLGGSIKLLHAAFGADPEVVRYLLNGKRPLWSTDPARTSFVLKLLDKRDGWYLFREFSIQDGSYTDVHVRQLDGKIIEARMPQDSGWVDINPQNLSEDYCHLIQVYEQDYLEI